MMYYAGFDVSTLSLGTLTLATAGKPNVVITLSSVTGQTTLGASTSKMFHGPADPVYTAQDGSGEQRLSDWAASNFADYLTNAMFIGATAQSWTSPAGLSCSINTSTGIITFSYASAVFSLTWSTTAGRQLCGFAGDQSGAQSYVGTVVPTYCIAATLPAASNNTPNYEPAGIANRIYADDGQGFGMAREVSPVCRDWLQQFETKEKTFTANAASTHPWTYEALFKYCRGQWPFVVVGGFGESFDEAFFFRSEGAVWRPERASEGNDAQFHIPFRTWVEASVA